jgi:CBS domain-containing protein
MLRFSDLLKLVLPSFLADSPYSTYFTGMFLAQIKVMGGDGFLHLMAEPVTVRVDAPLMEAVHLMVRHHQISLPVMDGERLVGVLRDRALVGEIARSVATRFPMPPAEE